MAVAARGIASVIHQTAISTAMAAGAVAFFQKPFDEKDLLGAIDKALNLNNT